LILLEEFFLAPDIDLSQFIRNLAQGYTGLPIPSASLLPASPVLAS
jgi:hypothetical protein